VIVFSSLYRPGFSKVGERHSAPPAVSRSVTIIEEMQEARADRAAWCSGLKSVNARQDKRGGIGYVMPRLRREIVALARGKRSLAAKVGHSIPA
jgi:hypothetical protein